MIQATGLTKKYGKNTVVHDLSFHVEKGYVTGFLGPNGSGKSTTMRMILGLDEPTRGQVLIDGKHYSEYISPLKKVGALLDASYITPGFTAQEHLTVAALSNNLDTNRVEECLSLVGLENVGNKKIGGFSLGMKQRLGIARALLGDPEYLMFDEPNNGLDPEGIRWMRDFMRSLAEEGKAVFVSSHQISELSKTADNVIVIGEGKMIADATMKEFTRNFSEKIDVTVADEDEKKMVLALRDLGATVEPAPTGFIVSGISAVKVGETARDLNIVLHQLAPRNSLEEAFLDATVSAQEYKTGVK